MASKKRKPAANEVVQSVENLFESRTVAEIREVEVKTKRDIEDKKLQLRQLVGDSYRDLLESADKIVAISRNCELIVENISSIQESLSGLIYNVSTSSQIPSDKNDPLRKHEELYAVGSRVKYLVDTPEMIWGCLDLQQYLGASRRFLRAKQVHNLLNKSFPTEMLARFPLLAHQWPQVEKFKKQIVDTVKQALVSSYDTSSKQVADALLAAAVLDSYDSQSTLQLLLDSRRAAVVQQLVQARDHAEQASVAKLLAGVAAMMQTCIFQVGELFLAPNKGAESSCLLQRVAHEDEVDAGELIFEGPRVGAVDGKQHEVEAWMQSNQLLHDRLQPLTSGQVEKACAAWVRDLEADCGALCVQLLGSCSTAASLVEVEAAVRSAVLAWVRPSTDQAGQSSRPSQRRKGDGSGQPGSGWEGVAEWVLGRPLHLWQEFFQLPFTTRAKQIIEAGFAAVRSGMEGPLKECMMRAAAAPPEAPGNVASQRWPQGLQSSASAMASTVDVTAAPPKQPAPTAAADTGPGGFRLAVQSIRRQFDQDLNRVMASAVLLLADPGAATESEQRATRMASSFSLGGSSFSLGPGGLAARRDAVRASELEPFVQLKCGELVAEVAAWLQSKLTAVTQPPPAVGAIGAPAVESALLLGRLAATLATESTALPLIMGPPEGWRTAGQPSSGAARMLAAASGYSRAGRASTAVTGSSSRLLQLGETMRGIALQAYRVWASWAATGLAADLGSALSSDEVLRCPTTPVSWVETVVSALAGDLEGGDDVVAGGASMEMRFMLPAVQSPAVACFLSRACAEVRRAGDHAAGLDALQLLAWELGGAAVQVLEKLLSPGGELDAVVSEKGVLQLLFDQRMLRDVLAGGKPLPVQSWEHPGTRASLSNAGSWQDDMAALSAERRRSWLSLQSLLTDRLDPIDWATYEPHLWSHVARSCQRGATLLGMLMQLQRAGGDTSSASKSTPAAAPSEGRSLNVMPVVSRFQFLPVSTPLHSHAHAAAQRSWSAAIPAAQATSKAGGGGCDLAAAYSFADLGSSTVGSHAVGGTADGPSSSGAAEASTSTLGALQAKLQAGSLGTFGTMLGDKAAEMTAMAQQKWEMGLGDLGTGLLSSLAKNVGVRNPMQK